MDNTGKRLAGAGLRIHLRTASGDCGFGNSLVPNVTKPLADVRGAFRTPKGLIMTPKFLRQEAARFRGMAESEHREPSRLRLLKMAADYESQADAVIGLTDEKPAEVSDAPVRSRKKITLRPSQQFDEVR